MAAKKQNSLVENINRRKKAGNSRSKARSTVSGAAYAAMQEGWPGKRSKAKVGAKASKKASTKRAAPRKKSTTKRAAPRKKSTTKRAAPRKKSTTKRAAPRKSSSR